MMVQGLSNTCHAMIETFTFLSDFEKGGGKGRGVGQNEALTATMSDGLAETPA